MSRRPIIAVWLAASVLLGTLPAAGRPLPPADETACSLALPGDRSLVGLAPGADADVLRRAGYPVVGGIRELGVVEIDLAAARLPAVRRLPGVEWAEREDVLHAQETPADPKYSAQWGLRAVQAPMAWNAEVGTTTGVKVAVLDTGVDLGHPDLIGKLTDGPNTVGGTSSQDDHVHGTHVAGIAAAVTNNRTGVAGMSWGARIVAIKVLGANGSGGSCGIAQGVVHAVQAGARVINMSLRGTGQCPALMQRAVDYATAHNALVVAAAGNDGAGFNHPGSPVTCEHVLGVGAVGPSLKRAAFSNYGSYVDVVAPGVDILSTVLDPTTQRRSYAAHSGTSMAAPFVAGLAALLASAHPDWTPAQISDRIMKTARDRGRKGWDPEYGHGLIDAAKALA